MQRSNESKPTLAPQSMFHPTTENKNVRTENDPKYPEIEGLINKLTLEIKDSTFFKVRKIKKKQFLEKLKQKYDENPSLTLRECLISLHCQLPTSYETTCSGVL